VTREELHGFADRVLDALVAGEPARIPAAPELRVTENARELPLGDGLWRTAKAVRFRQHVAEPAAGQIAIFAVVDEGGGLAVAALRLRVAGGQLRELETLASRKGESSIFGPESLASSNPRLLRELPAGQRTSREALVAAANAYFDAIERDAPAAVEFAPDCDRIENGVATTRNPAVLGGMGVAEQLERKVFAYIGAMRGRRFPIVDVERGAVLAIVFLDVPGTVTHLELGGRRVELPAHMRAPRSTLLFELFLVESGRIHAIEAFMHNLPYGASSGW